MNVFRRLQAKFRRIFCRTLGYYPTSIAGRRARVAPTRFEFWQDVAKGRWEPQTFEILGKCLSPTCVYYDIGAWVGPTVLYAAPRCREVVCFEPDPVAYQELRLNIALNRLSNVQSFSVALAAQLGIRRMASFGHGLGDSRTSLLNTDTSRQSVCVLGVPWSVFAEDPLESKPDVIKIDIEGGEFELLPHLTQYLQKHKPILYLSTHAPFLAASVRREKMQCLLGALSHYQTCMDEKLEIVNSAELVSDRSLAEFRAFVFR